MHALLDSPFLALSFLLFTFRTHRRKVHQLKSTEIRCRIRLQNSPYFCVFKYAAREHSTKGLGVICKRHLFYAHISSELKEPLKRTSCRAVKNSRIITSHTTAPETKSRSQAFPQKNRSRPDFFILPFVIKFGLSIPTFRDRHFFESKGQNWGKKRPVWTSLKPTKEAFLPEAKANSSGRSQYYIVCWY